MPSSLLALLDDISSMMDDVAVLSKVAARKTSGVMGDDLALNAEQASGVRLLLPLVESLGALDEIEDILTIDGISGAFIGCSDLAQVLGHPLDYLHPEVLGAIERTCRAAHARGKVVLANTGYAFPSIDGQVAHARALEAAGVDLIMLQTVEFHVYVMTRSIADGLRGPG